MRGFPRIKERRGMWGFWLMTLGMLGIVLSFTAAGIVQVYLYRLLGMPFMTVRTQFVGFWLFWVFFFGLVLFLPGVLITVWDFFSLESETGEPEAEGVRLRYPLLALAVLSLLAALWLGWVRVGRFFPSSRRCHRCHDIHQNLTLADRWFVCPHCGLECDRDWNASLNILQEAQLLAGRQSSMTFVSEHHRRGSGYIETLTTEGRQCLWTDCKTRLWARLDYETKFRQAGT